MMVIVAAFPQPVSELDGWSVWRLARWRDRAREFLERSHG